MKLSLFLAATLVLSISGASARPAHNAANHPILATTSPAIEIPASSPDLKAIQSAGPVAVPNPVLSEDVLSHPPAIPSRNSVLEGNINAKKAEMASSVLKLAPSPFPINNAATKQPKSSRLPPVSVLAPPTSAAANLKVTLVSSAAVNEKVVDVLPTVLPSVSVRQASSAVPLATSASVLEHALPTVLPSLVVFNPDSTPSVIDDLKIVPSSASLSGPKFPHIFDPESKSQSVNVLEGYPIVSTTLAATIPTSAPLVKVDGATKIASAAVVNYSSAPSHLADEFEKAVDDLMGTEMFKKVATTAFAGVLPTSSVLDVLDSVPKPSAEKVLPTTIILPVQPITVEPSLPAAPLTKPIASENGEKMKDAVPLPVPLSSIDLPPGPPKPTIISVALLPSLALPTPPPSTASAVLPHFPESLLPVQDKYVELAQSIGRASVALRNLKEAVDKFINEHLQDGKMIDVYNIRQQNKQPNLIRTFIDFQSIIEASKAAINRLPSKEMITKEDLQKLIKETHDLMVQARQMEIEYFEGMTGIKTNSQQFSTYLLEQGDIEKALKNDNDQEVKLPQLSPDELVKLVSQFVEDMQKFLIDFAKSFGEINPGMPTPTIQPVPEPILPSLPVASIPVPVPVSVPVQDAISNVPAVPSNLSNSEIAPIPIPSPITNTPTNTVSPAQPLPFQPAVTIKDILSNEGIFTDLDFVEFLGAGTTYAAVPTTVA